MVLQGCFQALNLSTQRSIIGRSTAQHMIRTVVLIHLGVISSVAHPSSITLEGKIKYREVSEEVEGVTFKHGIAEIHATSMKRLSKVEAADDRADGASEDDGAVQKEPEIISPMKRRKWALLPKQGRHRRP
jgi:hypothetical protein